jgi:shikimate dehydrogenase
VSAQAAAKLAGLVGWPVQHSLSPRLHAHWLREYGIDGAYVPLAVAREDFYRVIDALPHMSFAGVNVTIPYKQAAFALAHRVDEAAIRTGAVNLLLFSDDGRIEGRNTDVSGLCASAREELGAGVVQSKVAVVLGAGGAARAAVLALTELGAQEIRIANRNEVRARLLIADLQSHCTAKLVSVGWGHWAETAEGASLLVNATSGGMAGSPPLDIPLDPLPPTAAVCDLIYNPLETELLKSAQVRAHRTMNGLGLLMHQAVPSFEAFFGIRPQVTAALRHEFEQALAA